MRNVALASSLLRQLGTTCHSSRFPRDYQAPTGKPPPSPLGPLYPGQLRV